MGNTLVGLSVIGLIFLLVIILGLQIQITGIARRIDEVLDKVKEDNP